MNEFCWVCFAPFFNIMDYERFFIQNFSYFTPEKAVLSFARPFWHTLYARL